MSLLSATQIPIPSDEQAFERVSIVLWRCLLKDPNIQRCGRRGQPQNGVDLLGIRNDDPSHLVGIQCKLKGTGRKLTEKEVREELDKALTFNPELHEYFITTTAPDDVKLQQLARELSIGLKKNGRRLLIHVWGWNTLEERITEHPEARKAFDPTFNPFIEQILEKVNEGNILQTEIKTLLKTELSAIGASLTRIEVTPDDITATADKFEAHVDAEIDELRELANDGKPRTALPLFERLLVRVNEGASGRILFRIKANIAHCLLALGKDENAAQLLSEAFDHAPTEPKAVANKALSLLIRGHWKELITFGTEVLHTDPTNDSLAGYLVEAFRFDETIDDPLDFIPEMVKKSAAVANAHVDFLRHRGRIPDWWQAARETFVLHPENRYAQQIAAEADLDEILRSTHFKRTGQFEPEERSRITAAANVLQEHWSNVHNGEGVVRPEHLVLCNNLIVALHALGDFPKALDIARQGVAIVPDNSELLNRAAAAAIDGGDETFASDILSRLPAGSDATILKFQFHAQRGDWAEVAELCKQEEEFIPETERIMVATTGRLTAIKLNPGKDDETLLNDVVKDVVEDSRASIVAANFAMEAGFEKIGEKAYYNALRNIDAESHFAARYMVAMHAVKREDWESVADLLDGNIAEAHDSEELRALATALANESPIRKRATHFIGRLPLSISSSPFYLHIAGLIHYNRGALKKAEISFREAIQVSSSLSNYLALFGTLRRANQQKKIAPILESRDLTKLTGSPVQRMCLAQELFKAGQHGYALSFAYKVLKMASSDPQVALGYFGLLMSETSSRMIPPTNTVSVDSWVRLEEDKGERFDFIIEEGKDRPAEGILSPKHKMALSALGLKVGAFFELEQQYGFGEKTTWYVREIKHKYLHALHDVMENFQTRFPDATGLYRFQVRDGDAQPVLEQVKKMAEMNRKFADLYLLKHFPIALIASKLGRDTIGFADYIKSLGYNIEVCVGTGPERFSALSLIAQHRTDGVVLDNYTAWTIATMDVLDILIAVFGRILVPQSVIDELNFLKKEDELLTRRSYMTIAWHDGQFIRHEVTEEDFNVRNRFIDDQIQKILHHCQIEAVLSPDSPTKLASLLTQVFDAHVLDSANLAAEGHVLLSEDMHFRQIANTAVSVKGVWLQAVLYFAKDSGIISSERYADAIVKLALRRHSYLALDALTLWDLLRGDSEDLEQFHSVANFIGTKDADIQSHIYVASEFLNTIWKTSFPESKDKRASGILLGELIKNHFDNDWADILVLLIRKSNPNLRRYILGWVQGHFLSMDKLQEAARR